MSTHEAPVTRRISKPRKQSLDGVPDSVYHFGIERAHDEGYLHRVVGIGSYPTSRSGQPHDRWMLTDPRAPSAAHARWRAPALRGCVEVPNAGRCRAPGRTGNDRDISDGTEVMGGSVHLTTSGCVGREFGGEPNDMRIYRRHVNRFWRAFHVEHHVGRDAQSRPRMLDSTNPSRKDGAAVRFGLLCPAFGLGVDCEQRRVSVGLRLAQCMGAFIS